MTNLEDLFAELHKVTVEELIRRVQDPESTPAVLDVARRLLADNGVSQALKTGKPLHNLAVSLPFADPTLDKPLNHADRKILPS